MSEAGFHPRQLFARLIGKKVVDVEQAIADGKIAVIVKCEGNRYIKFSANDDGRLEIDTNVEATDANSLTHIQ